MVLHPEQPLRRNMYLNEIAITALKVPGKVCVRESEFVLLIFIHGNTRARERGSVRNHPLREWGNTGSTGKNAIYGHIAARNGRSVRRHSRFGQKKGMGFINSALVGGEEKSFQQACHIWPEQGGGIIGNKRNNTLCGPSKTGLSEATPYVGALRH